MVALAPSSWRGYLVPAAALVAVTAAVVVVRGELRHHTPAAQSGHATTGHTAAQPQHRPARFYVVRAGDTIDGIAARTNVPAAQIMKLNHGISPTALFIGERIRLR